ncbi:MAG: ABC transporter permease [Clostridia bacterium]|nr:ABC transporter permease [Clostridia bacterium]
MEKENEMIEEIVNSAAENVTETTAQQETAMAEAAAQTVEEMATEAEEKEEKEGFLSDNIRVLSPGRMVMKRFFRSRLSLVGLVIIVGLFLFSFVGPVFSSWGEKQTDTSGGAPIQAVTGIEFVDPSATDRVIEAYIVTIETPELNRNQTKATADHWLGTDDMGMDILTRLMYGGRISLTLGFIVVILETIIGIILGGLAGYFGKWVDMIVMRVVDILNCIPSLPIMLIISVVLDSRGVDGRYKIYYMMVMMTVLGWSGIARLVRGQILMLREQEYMVASEASGIPVWQQIFKHLVPNIMPQLIVTMTLGLGSIILTEATLGFLGLGVEFPSASWGTMIEAGANPDVLRSGYWNMWIPAGICIVMAVLGFNFIGDGLRDAFDPKMKR